MPVSPPASLKSPIVVPEKLLMGPGPSNVSKRVLEAQALPTLGHLHGEFTKIMDDTKAGIQYAFQTNNALTLALSSTGHSAMEAVMTNMLQEGDVVLIAENGIWGQRAGDMASRQGADVRKVHQEAGVPFSLADIEAGLKEHKPLMFFMTHGESSTGVCQPMEGLGDLCKRYNCLLAVDTVASLGGVPIAMDELGIDVMYTGSQKVLGVPPGLAPISFNDKALSVIKGRRSPPKSFYLDMNWLGKYWNCYEGEGRVYHHTGPVNQVYALREGLAMLAEEGLEACHQRHRRCADRLWKGLENLGMEFYVSNPSHRLPTVTTVKVPTGIDWKAVVGHSMSKHRVEIAGGLGPSAGKVWRIGVMGQNATEANVDRALAAFEDALKQQKM